MLVPSSELEGYFGTQAWSGLVGNADSNGMERCVTRYGDAEDLPFVWALVPFPGPLEPGGSCPANAIGIIIMIMMIRKG